MVFGAKAKAQSCHEGVARGGFAEPMPIYGCRARLTRLRTDEVQMLIEVN
jgi:uncharacterized protein YecT (DUF1311 family)